MRPPKQKQPQVKKGLCRVLVHVDVDEMIILTLFFLFNIFGRKSRASCSEVKSKAVFGVWVANLSVPSTISTVLVYTYKLVYLNDRNAAEGKGDVHLLCLR